MNSKIDDILNSWYNAKEEISSLEKKCDKYKKQIETIMDSDEKVIAEETCVALWEEGVGSFTFAPSTKHRGLSVEDFFKRYRSKEIQFIRWVEIIGNIFENPELDLIWEQGREEQYHQESND